MVFWKKSPTSRKLLAKQRDAIYPVGKVGFRQGLNMAPLLDELYITVKGKGGHAAMPETLIDPVLIAPT